MAEVKKELEILLEIHLGKYFMDTSRNGSRLIGRIKIQ
jgi:hypothetical protein